MFFERYGRRFLVERSNNTPAVIWIGTTDSSDAKSVITDAVENQKLVRTDRREKRFIGSDGQSYYGLSFFKKSPFSGIRRILHLNPPSFSEKQIERLVESLSTN